MIFGSKGLTLIEILIVITLIIVLALAVVIAINPGERLSTARDSSRERNLITLQGATYAYYIDNMKYPADNIPEFYTAGEEKSREICNTNLETSNCSELIDLSILVEDGYIPYIPTDPHGSDNENGTGYYMAEGSLVLHTQTGKAETRNYIVIGVATSTFLANYAPQDATETPTHTVTYFSGEGICNPTTRIVAENDPAPAPTCQREGYTVNNFILTQGACVDFSASTGYCPSTAEDMNISVVWEAEFSCEDPVDYYGYSYSTVEIGTQCWFQENLRYTGTGCLSRGWDASANACRANGGKGWSKDEVLYQWEAAMEAGCPEGWHIPTDVEWHILENYLSTGTCDPTRNNIWDCNPAGATMKTSAWEGNNSSGFTALPVGYRNESGSLYSIDSVSRWWSSSVDDSFAYYRHLHASLSIINRYSYGRALGYSVRCIKEL